MSAAELLTAAAAVLAFVLGAAAGVWAARRRRVRAVARAATAATLEADAIQQLTTRALVLELIARAYEREGVEPPTWLRDLIGDARCKVSAIPWNPEGGPPFRWPGSDVPPWLASYTLTTSAPRDPIVDAAGDPSRWPGVQLERERRRGGNHA